MSVQVCESECVHEDVCVSACACLSMWVCERVGVEGAGQALEEAHSARCPLSSQEWKGQLELRVLLCLLF